MIIALALFAMLCSLIDNWVTYLCMAKVEQARQLGWVITESNPVTAWLFERCGVLPALAIDSCVTATALVVVARTELLPLWAKTTFLAIVCLWTFHAIFNNLEGLQTIETQAAWVAGL